MFIALIALAVLAALWAPLLRRMPRGRGLKLRERLALMLAVPDAGVITLADAQVNAQDDVDFSVIDQFRRSSWLLDQITFDDCVSPGSAGATLTYGYTRLIQAHFAAFRAINSEYTPGQAKRQRFTTDLKPLGGSFPLDRVIARLGNAATNETSFQMEQLIQGTQNKFADETINGDTAVDANGFDGLDKSLVGTSTEYLPIDNGQATGYFDWTAATVDDQNKAQSALDVIDEWLALVVGGAQAIMGNRRSITRVRSLARRAGYYSRQEDALGRTIERYGNAVLVDVGTKVDADVETDIIPIETRDPDGAGAGGNITGLTDLYAVRFGMDAFHGVSAVGPLVTTILPNFELAGAVQDGEVEMGPVSMVLKKTTGAAVLRNVKVQ